MSSPDRFYGSHGKIRRSSPGADAGQGVGLFHGQGGRPRLPPISSAFPTSPHFPVPIHPNPYFPRGPSPGRNDFNLPYQWNPPPQQHPPSFPYGNHDPRYGYPTVRTSPSPPNEPYPRPRLPPMSIPTSTRREEEWGSFPAHMPDEIFTPTASYPTQYGSSQYDSHMPQQTPYPYPAMPPDNRNMPFPTASYNQQSSMYMGPQSPVERVTVTRGKDTHPYARSSGTPQSMGYGAEAVVPPHEPIIKKKRKRADAGQLKVLNETYQRTAFPSTEERQELARRLDMPARSVQIWFQNRRQSDRQRSHQSAATSSNHPDDGHSHLAVGSYGNNIPSMTPTTAGYLPRSSRDHRSRSQEASGDPRKWPGRLY